MTAMKSRQRASRACDICKRKKIRCSGNRPCQLCTRDELECTYDAPYFRGKVKRRKEDRGNQPSIISPPPSSKSLPLPLQCPTHSRSSTGDIIQPPPPPPQHPILPTSPHTSSPEPGESDQSGHFVGASSGLSFPLRLQRRLRQDTAAAVFSLGDPPLPAFDRAAFEWPPAAEADDLLATYFDLASPTYRFLHRPTVEGWLRQLYRLGAIEEPYSQGKAAVLLAAFAQATGYIKSLNGSDAGLRYFLAAQSHLDEQAESTNIPSVQAMLGSCIYTLTCSRLNHCWTLFGATARIIFALGLHRRRTASSYRYYSQDRHHGVACKEDVITHECAKRVFWSAFTLDKYLSAIFGRPSALQDDDADQDLPSIVDDAHLTLTAPVVLIPPPNSINVMLAPVYHHQMARILSSTLKQLYGVRAPDRQRQYQIMDELGAQVTSWRDSLATFLNPEKVDSRLLRPLFQRQSNLLSLASGHVEVLIYRPCLLNDLPLPSSSSSSSSSSSTPEESRRIEANVQRCLDAAMSIVSIIDLMVETGQFYPVSWFAHYQAFSAVVVLYTFTIRSRGRGAATWSRYYDAAQRCQGLIAAVPKADSLGRRLLLIMEEYHREVLAQLTPSDTLTDAPIHVSDIQNSWLSSGNACGLTELPDWEQLNSLALDTGFVDFEMNMSTPQLI